MKKTTLIIFGKFPREGFVKTRLAATTGHTAATEFFRLCIEHIFEVADMARPYMDPVFCFAEADDEPAVVQWIGTRLPLIPQIKGTLMERNREAFRHVFAQGYERALIIATDIPDISQDILLAALRELDTTDIVIGPDQLDGYYLLGMNDFHSKLFAVSYTPSTPLLPQIVAQANTLGLRVQTLPILYNINTIDDLKEWHTANPDSTNPVRAHSVHLVA